VPDDAWWSISLDPDTRANPDAARLTGDDGRPLVNAPDADGRLGLDYAAYLQLDRLLDAQAPSSLVPDERAFIVIHQLCEVAFKLMAFDLGVVAHTAEALGAMDDEAFARLAAEPMPQADDRGPDPFWRPALTAAARLRHTARHVLPALMPYVGLGDDNDVLFSSLEFAHFRFFLTPSSGFQSAQLRLIQRALGKEALFSIPVFPGEAFGQHYQGCPAGHLALTDELVLRTGHARAFPPADAPDAIVARTDELVHAVLARFARLKGVEVSAAVPPVLLIRPEDVARVVTRFRTTLGRDADETPAIGFEHAMTAVAAAENARREGLADARRGAVALRATDHATCLAFVLDRLAETDDALHGPESATFFSVHRRTVRRHVTDDAGTGGGGMPYLVTSHRFLLPLFPALVAYADLGEPDDGDTDRW